MKWQTGFCSLQACHMKLRNQSYCGAYRECDEQLKGVLSNPTKVPPGTTWAGESNCSAQCGGKEVWLQQKHVSNPFLSRRSEKSVLKIVNLSAACLSLTQLVNSPRLIPYPNLFLLSFLLLSQISDLQTKALNLYTAEKREIHPSRIFHPET